MAMPRVSSTAMRTRWARQSRPAQRAPAPPHESPPAERQVARFAGDREARIVHCSRRIRLVLHTDRVARRARMPDGHVRQVESGETGLVFVEAEVDTGWRRPEPLEASDALEVAKVDAETDAAVVCCADRSD